MWCITEFKDGRNLYYVSNRNICKVESLLYSNLQVKGGEDNRRLRGSFGRMYMRTGFGYDDGPTGEICEVRLDIPR